MIGRRQCQTILSCSVAMASPPSLVRQMNSSCYWRRQAWGPIMEHKSDVTYEVNRSGVRCLVKMFMLIGALTSHHNTCLRFEQTISHLEKLSHVTVCGCQLCLQLLHNTFSSPRCLLKSWVASTIYGFLTLFLHANRRNTSCSCSHCITMYDPVQQIP